MLVLVCLLILMMKTMKSDAASAEIITAHSGEAVLLTSDLPGGRLKRGQDVRWTHPHLVMSLKNNMTTCHHGRCELLRNGSLRFSRVQTADSGNYSLEVFDEVGTRLMKRGFLLKVEEYLSAGISSSSSVVPPVLTCCFLLMLLFFVAFVILKRRRSQTTRAAGPLEENVYEMMHSNHGNKRKNEEEKEQERKEEPHYVACNPAVSMETAITQQMPLDEEDIYV